MICMELHSRQPFLAVNLNLIARIKYQLNKIDEALLFAEASVVVSPGNPLFLAFLAEINRKAGRIAESLEVSKLISVSDQEKAFSV